MKIWTNSPCGKYRIESLSKKTFPGAIDVIKKTFFKYEAVCIGSEVNINPEAGRELEELCADAALDGVSVVAVHMETDQVVSVAFNKLQVPPANAEDETFFDKFANERCKQESARSLIRFMSIVDGECDLFEKYSVDCILEIMFLATLMEHGNKQLATILCQVSTNIAKELKNGPVTAFAIQDLNGLYENVKHRDVTSRIPKLCSAIFTSKISQKIAYKLNFNTDLVVPYTMFKHNGKTYADRIGPESPSCVLTSKQIS